MKTLKTIEDVDSFMLKHGENIVDLIGAEIDRIEKELKKKHPEVRHIDLELL
jgi:zinc transporter 9